MTSGNFWNIVALTLAIVLVILVGAMFVPSKDSAEQVQPSRAALGVSREDGELLVKFRRGADRNVINAAVGGRTVRRFRGDPLLEEIKLAPGSDRGRAIGFYRKFAEVEYAQPNARIYLTATPNDTYASAYQWAWHNTGLQRGGCAGCDVRAWSAWDVTTGSRTVIVADLDTGVDYTHPDLAANLMPGWDFANSDSDPRDTLGHGTHTAGTIGAVGNNGIGVTGAAWAVRILPVKIFADPGTTASTAAAIEAVDYAAEGGARVINASWGCWALEGDAGCGGNQALHDAVTRAESRGVLIVAAAANNGWNIDDPNEPGHLFFPCAYPNANVICAAMTDPNDGLAIGSNWGAVSVDLGAPGQTILSTYPMSAPPIQFYLNGPWVSGYAWMSGTSMAAPVVTGLAALLLSCDPTMSVATLRNRILSTVRPLPSLAGMTVTGGIANFQTALSGLACGQIAATAIPARTATRTATAVLPTATRLPPTPTTRWVPPGQLKKTRTPTT